MTYLFIFSEYPETNGCSQAGAGVIDLPHCDALSQWRLWGPQDPQAKKSTHLEWFNAYSSPNEFCRWIPGLYTSCIFTLMTFAAWIMSYYLYEGLSVEKSDEIWCDIRFEGVSRHRCFIDCFTGAIFAIDWGDLASCFSLLPIVQGTQVASGTIGLPFAQSESLQAWQRLTDGDLATVRTSKDILDVLVGCHGVDDKGHVYQMIIHWVLIPVRHIFDISI